MSAAFVAVITQLPILSADNVVPETEQLPGLVVTPNVTAPVPDPPVVLNVVVEKSVRVVEPAFAANVACAA